jgi:ubiquinone/menaquinone biosynthesis C-methylase UbiE
MRVLDLGCGSGRDLARWGVTSADEVTGVDVDENRLVVARERFGNRRFLQGVGESLPFEDESFDRVISALSLPYMNIGKALAEIHRVLAAGGNLTLSLHPLSFAISEFIHKAIPKPTATVYGLYIIANGAWFHCSGTTLEFPNGRTESFQTERGMKIALRRAGFEDVTFRRGTGPVGETFGAEARKEMVRGPAPSVRAA